MEEQEAGLNGALDELLRARARSNSLDQTDYCS